MTNQEYELRSGRTVGVSLTGDPFSDDLVAFCHPERASGPFDPNPLVTRRYGAQLLSLDRAGYGGSEPLGEGDEASAELFADDLAEYARDRALVAYRGLDGRPSKMAVVGWGFGGAIALTVAARHPELVRSVVTVATPEPARLAQLEDGLLHHTAGVDWSALERIAPGIGNRLDRLNDDSAAGNAADQTARRNVSWAGELSRVSAPVSLVYGAFDDSATREDGRWYQSRIPGSRIVMVRDAGPLAIGNVWAQILSRLSQ